MKLYATLAAAALLALGVLAAGCGSSDDNDSSTSDLTKSAWIAKADAICQQGNQEIEQAAKEQFGNQKPSEADIQQFTQGVVLLGTQDQVDKIRALGAPSGDEDAVNKILDTVQADIDKAKDSSSIDNSTFADGNALAKQYGLKVCGQD